MRGHCSICVLKCNQKLLGQSTRRCCWKKPGHAPRATSIWMPGATFCALCWLGQMLTTYLLPPTHGLCQRLHGQVPPCTLCPEQSPAVTHIQGTQDGQASYFTSCQEQSLRSDAFRTPEMCTQPKVYGQTDAHVNLTGMHVQSYRCPGVPTPGCRHITPTRQWQQQSLPCHPRPPLRNLFATPKQPHRVCPDVLPKAQLLESHTIIVPGPCMLATLYALAYTYPPPIPPVAAAVR